MIRPVLLFLASILPAAAAFRLESTASSLKVFDGDALVTEYRTDSRVPYLYPLVVPGGGSVTRHWPVKQDVAGEEHDHPHHRSFWLSHGSVDGFDFWAWQGPGDPKIEHRAFVSQSVQGDTAAFTVDLAWNADGKTRLKERRTYTFRKTDATTLEIETASELVAPSAPVTFGDTKEGFFALRVDRALRQKGKLAKGGIVDSEGRKDGDCWGKRADWVAFHGPGEQSEPVVVAMMDHPSGFRHPTWWHARDYGLLAANPFGIHDFENRPSDKGAGNHVLPQGDSLKFRYLVVLHRGTLASADLATHWNTFSR